MSNWIDRVGRVGNENETSNKEKTVYRRGVVVTNRARSVRDGRARGGGRYDVLRTIIRYIITLSSVLSSAMRKSSNTISSVVRTKRLFASAQR